MAQPWELVVIILKRKCQRPGYQPRGGVYAPPEQKYPPEAGGAASGSAGERIPGRSSGKAA